MIKGVIHAHSTYSYDGENSITEISQWATNNNLNFVILAEHDNTFDVVTFKKFKTECKKLSTSQFVIIPGIEYSFGENGNIHVTVFGNNTFIKEKSLDSFLDIVHENNGVAILNHPFSYRDKIINDILKKFDFMEIWNIKYDYSYAPYRVLLNLARKYKLKAIISSDIHKFPSNVFGAIQICSSVSQPINENLIMNKLKNREYFCKFGNWEITPNAKIINYSFYRKILTSLTLYHGYCYAKLRKIMQKIGYKPPKKLVDLLKQNFKKDEH